MIPAYVFIVLQWFCMVSECFCVVSVCVFVWFLDCSCIVSAWLLCGFLWFLHGFCIVFAWFLLGVCMVLHVSVWFLYAFWIISGFPAYRCRCFLNSSDIQKSEYLGFSYIFSSRNANTIVFAISFTCRELLQDQHYSTPLSSVE